MNHDQFNQYLNGITLICIAGSIFNLGKVKRRGKGAYYLSAAFLTFGCGAYLIKINANSTLLAIAGAATFGLLAADILFRMQRPPTRSKGR